MNELRKRNENGAADRDKWGWMVCFGTIITFIAGMGHVSSFGLIYNDFVNNTHSTAKSLTTSHGVFAVMLAVGGIILNVMSKNYSLRTGGYVGAVIMITGSFATIFITNTNQLPITFGVLQGIGFGIMVSVCYSTINHYFVKRRTMVMSISKAVQGFVLIWYPHLLKKILSHYGFRGALLIIFGISLHTIPGMTVMTTDRGIRKISSNKNGVEQGTELENINLMDCVNKDGALNHQVDSSHKKSVDKIFDEILRILNLKVLKDPVYCNICFGQSFVNFSDLTFFIFQPMLLFQHGYNTTQVATCISICSGADVAGRCALALISSSIHVNTRLLFFIATFFTLFFRIAILQCIDQFVWVAVLTGVLGVLRAFLHVASPLVVSDHVSHKDFPSAYALFMLTTGLVNVVCAPLIGLMKDVYQDYVPAFYTLSICCIPCLLCWSIEYIATGTTKKTLTPL